jgi:hypothetical protein
MLEAAVVVVYGIPAGRRQPRRVGTGRLQLRTLVTADTRLDRRMALPNPPRLVRVGIGWVTKGRPSVEVIEILQVHPTDPAFAGSPELGLELLTASTAPTEADVFAANHPGLIPASLWCKLFPKAKFCS